jgi:signal transduction histidine kinase
VLNYQVEALDVQDEQLLAAIGHQMGVAIENAQLAQEATEVEILREVDHFRSELIANVSHELRTPLGLISIFCTSLLMDDVTFDRDTQLEFLQGIEKQAGKLEGIVENLLDMERMESERLCLDKRPTDLAQIAHDLSRSFAEQYPNHTLTYHFSTEPFVVSVDPKRIEQVLRNLLSNALKYSPEGGEIRVEGRRDARQAVLQVSDSGIGIPAEEQARIFERFYRVDNELTRRVGGVGLGLAVCQGIVEAHGGRIWVESALGEGTTVYFSLPVDPHPDEDILV